MRWEDFRRSDNVEDDRGGGGGFAGGGGLGGGGMGLPTGGMGIGTIIVIALIAWALGINPLVLLGGADVLQGGGSTQTRNEQPAQPRTSRNSPPRDQTGDFISAVLGNTEDIWGQTSRGRPDLSATKAAAVLRLGADTLRLRAIRHGTILLPDRSAGLSRHVVLP